jgi:hypothetical protein
MAINLGKKALSNPSSDSMTARGGAAEDRANSGSGPTGSSRSYPKGAVPGDTDKAPFNPRDDTMRSGTDLYVGGV